MWKQSLIMLLAYRTLTQLEWKTFREKFGHLKDPRVRLHRISLKLPFAKKKHVTRDYVHLLREAM